MSNTNKHIRKIIVFYDDDTIEEYDSYPQQTITFFEWLKQLFK